MKRLTRTVSGIVLVGSSALSFNASAELSYNLGFASEYYYRGILQKESSASAGVDYTNQGFYVGAWAADVGIGLETDIYLGYGMDFTDLFSGSIGYTGYFYTDEGFDDTYQEINLGLGVGILSLGYSFGEWDGYGLAQDYGFLEATLEHAGFYATVGSFGRDFDGDYLELGYGFSAAELDFGIAALLNSKELSDQTNGGPNSVSGEAIIFTVGKTF